MSEKQAVTVKILDREYRLACEPEERRQLLDAADYLDSQMRGIREGMKMVSIDKLAVLTALNITNEHLQLKAREAEVGGDIATKVSALKEQLSRL